MATAKSKPEKSLGALARTGIAFAAWAERWFPDPLVFALLAVIVIFGLAVMTGEQPGEVARQAGKNFWGLIPFTMQMVMVLVGGYVVASTPAIGAAVRWVAARPKSARGAVALVALFSMGASLLSWGLSLIFSGLLVRELARTMPRLDYRAAGAAAYLGLGVTWAQGLSSSAAMLMATPSSLPPSLVKISGIIPLTQTLFLPQNMLMTAILIAVAAGVAYASAPSEANARTAADLGISPAEPLPKTFKPEKPGEWLEHFPGLTILVFAILAFYLVGVFRTAPNGALAALDLNTYNLIFIAAGLILHGRPVRFLRAVNECVPVTAGIIIQYPFYAMIFGMIVNTGLSQRMSNLFIAISSHETYPLLVAAYSSVLGIFIPSGGSKWIIEAPYVLTAAMANKIHLGWVVQIYNAAESLPNLINPFFMLPLVGILNCKARDLVGYGLLQFIVLTPLVYFLCWAFALTFRL